MSSGVVVCVCGEAGVRWWQVAGEAGEAKGVAGVRQCAVRMCVCVCAWCVHVCVRGRGCVGARWGWGAV